MSSYSSNGSETTSWVKDAQDLQKTIPLVAILGILYLMGKLLLGWVRNKQRLEQIQEEVNAKCTECIEAETRIRELELRAQIAEAAAREAKANWRAAKAEELPRERRLR